MRVVAVDPGKMTGIAVYTDGAWEAFEKPAGEAMLWLQEQLRGWLDLTTGAVVGRPDVVVCEGITITANTHKKGQEVLISVEQIGISRFLSAEYGVEFVVQQPGERKFTTDKKLHALGWWKVGPHDHPREATRHLVFYLCKVDSAFRDHLAGMI